MSTSPSQLRRRDYPPMVKVTSKSPCPICGKPTWCNLSADGDRVVCMRVKSERSTRNGGWLHILRDRLPEARQHTAPVIKPEPAKNSPELAPLGHRSRVYSKLISLLKLSPTHRNALLSRGLTEEEISCLGYRSMPAREEADAVAGELSAEGLEQVPGFFRQGRLWRMRALGPGILIPVRDPSLHIQAFQVRRDEGSPRYIWLSSSDKPGGASSGAPVHFSRAAHINERAEAILTEGALKADIIALRANSAVIAIAGVNSFPEGFGLQLKKLLPQLKNVVLAYDQDWREKPQVKNALFRMMRELGRGGFQVTVRNWPREYKGYDDYLVRGL